MEHSNEYPKHVEYPGTLDVVDWKGENGAGEFQVFASVQTGTPENDQFLVGDTFTLQRTTIIGATFLRYTPMQIPQGLYVF